MPITRFMSNVGGLNITDSPLSLRDNQATGQSYNYDYGRTGAITKVLASSAINSSPDAQLQTRGMGVHHAADTDVRTPVRAAGTKIQAVDFLTGGTIDQALDTAAAPTDFLDAGTQQPVVMIPFNTFDGGVQLSMAGGGMDSVYAYTGSEITKNGVVAPEGAITTTVNTSSGGAFPSTGTYFYGIQYRKRSTQAVSNVALDKSAVIVNVDDTVTLDLTGITGLDTTLMDKFVIWRSAVGGVEAFTTGSIVAIIDSTETSYEDDGSSLSDSENVPRAGNVILDNSVLPDGTYNCITTFKRRLVTCADSTLYLSDLNKNESWPLTNRIVIPSGGPITGVSYIGVPSEYTTGAEEYLAIFKENELWVLTGTDISNWELKFVDKTGCPSQSLIISFNGFLGWITYTGIYLWQGNGRPIRCSRPIHALFDADGDLDKAKLFYGYACQNLQSNQVIWRVSHKTKGTNKLSIKMDTKLTGLAISQNLQTPEADGIFMLDTDDNSYYAICSYVASTKSEYILAGDDAGYIYQLYNSASSAVAFQYETKPYDMGAAETNKRFKRVIVYIEKLSDMDLTLNYWVDYRIRPETASQINVSMAPGRGTQPALWDIALWDVGLWDDYVPDIGIIQFNLHDEENNAQGVSLKLQFEQLQASAPVRIHGWAVEWDEIGPVSIPTGQIN